MKFKSTCAQPVSMVHFFTVIVWYWYSLTRLVSCCTCRLQHALTQKIDASGYREKAPQNMQEEDMRKLTALLEQLEVISEAEKKLDAKIGNN